MPWLATRSVSNYCVVFVNNICASLSHLSYPPSAALSIPSTPWQVILFAKLGAYAYSGSGAMLSEAMHSGADVMNQCLLFYGLQRSAKGGELLPLQVTE